MRAPSTKTDPATITVSKITAATLSTTVTGTGGVTVDFAVGEAKAEASMNATASVTWTAGRTYTRNTSSSTKYENVQYGSWGHTAVWEKYYELPDCTKSRRTSGSVRVANTSVGFRYRETSS
ncbi:hypothetical protein ACE14D_05815 [Streptomyces sp. Act-28]